MGIIKAIRKLGGRKAPRRAPRRVVRVEAGNWYRWRIKIVNVPTESAARRLIDNSHAGHRVHDLRVIREGDPLVFEYTAFQLGDATVTLGAPRDVGVDRGVRLDDAPEASERIVSVHLTPRPR